MINKGDNFKMGKSLSPDKSPSLIVVEDILGNIIENVVNISSVTKDKSPLIIIVEDILKDIVENVVLSENKEKQYTKKGTERKRKMYDISTQERKKQKRIDKVVKHDIQAICSSSCIRNCTRKITEERIKQINKEFWSLSDTEQKQFVFSALKNTQTKRKTKDENVQSRRGSTILYYFKDANGNDCHVCKKFFLGTLGYGISNDRLIRDVLNKSSSEMLVFNKKRKGHSSEKKIDRSNISNHITSFCPTISHYRREHAPNKKYLPSDINITIMHKDYLEKYPNTPVSYELYRKEVASMNISFAVLGNEECWHCESFLNHSKSTNHQKESMPLDCEDCKSWKKHHDHAISARKEYKNDVSKESSFSVDLQKVFV